VRLGKISIQHVPSEQQLADIATKPQPEALFTAQRDALLLWPYEDCSKADFPLTALPTVLSSATNPLMVCDDNVNFQLDVYPESNPVCRQPHLFLTHVNSDSAWDHKSTLRRLKAGHDKCEEQLKAGHVKCEKIQVSANKMGVRSNVEMNERTERIGRTDCSNKCKGRQQSIKAAIISSKNGVEEVQKFQKLNKTKVTKWQKEKVVTTS
jgi:hypothetical protein